MRNNYVTYIVAMRPYLSRLGQFTRLLCVAAMSSLPQLRLRDGYREAEATLACLSGSERRRPGWFLDMKYQNCFMYIYIYEVYVLGVKGCVTSWAQSAPLHVRVNILKHHT